MVITDFNHNHIEEAAMLAKANYEEERSHVPVLPKIQTLPNLKHFADNGLGVAAFENGGMVGFLCSCNIWDGYTLNAKGAFSPVHAHGTVIENREKVYKLLYQRAAKKWVSNKAAHHAVALYAHDLQAVNSFFTYGFGLRCIDAIRPMEPIEYSPCPNCYRFCELNKESEIEILVLNNILISHLGESPAFMSYPQLSKEKLQEELITRPARHFAVYNKKDMIAYLKIRDDGENFACDDDSMLNIQGACCLPEYRGKGVYQNLLNFTIATLKNEGYTSLGVDFESFNPTAYGFWLKYFTAYTSSVVRRIDERILKVN